MASSPDPTPTEPLERLRALVDLLPEAVEVELLGEVAFRVAATTFALVDPADRPLTVVCKLRPAQQQDRLGLSGVSPAPDTGHHGWTRVALDGTVAWDEVDATVVEAYRGQAPAHLQQVLDAMLDAADPEG